MDEAVNGMKIPDVSTPWESVTPCLKDAKRNLFAAARGYAETGDQETILRAAAEFGVSLLGTALEAAEGRTAVGAAGRSDAEGASESDRHAEDHHMTWAGNAGPPHVAVP